MAFNVLSGSGQVVDSVSGEAVQPEYSLDSISQGYADMLRGDYDDWLNRFKPYEALQQSFLLDPEKREQLRNNALGYVDSGLNEAYGRTTAGMNARDRRYGVSLDADEQAARNRRLQQQRNLLSAQGRTRMLQYLGDRDLQILSGGVR